MFPVPTFWRRFYNEHKLKRAKSGLGMSQEPETLPASWLRPIKTEVITNIDQSQCSIMTYMSRLATGKQTIIYGLPHGILISACVVPRENQNLAHHCLKRTYLAYLEYTTYRFTCELLPGNKKTQTQLIHLVCRSPEN